jgi:8-oxo-dGTP diphosphatase
MAESILPAHGMTRAEIDTYQFRWGKGPFVAADVAVVSARPAASGGVETVVLLVQRRDAPFQGRFALPGGFVEPDEDIEEAARRELAEETGLAQLGGAYLEQLETFGAPGRDPRGRVVSVVHLALVAWASMAEPRAGDDAAAARFFVIRDGEALDEQGSPVSMAFDHDRAMESVQRRVAMLARTSSAPLLLVGERFELAEARAVYEALLGAPVRAEALGAWLEGQGWAREAESGGTGERAYERLASEVRWARVRLES